MIILKTLYIDVYFLINFTVDVLAIFVALRLSSVKIKTTRIIISGAIGALFAILNLIYVDTSFLRFLLEISLVLFITFFACGKISLIRRAKFAALFYLSSFIISGAVTYIYGLLDKYLNAFSEDANSSENRGAIMISLVILLLIGVLRILIMVFTNSINEKSARIYIRIEDKTLELDALIDSGNLVKDPMNMNPVLFLKKVAASYVFPSEVMELSDIDRLDSVYKKRIRLIPVTRNEETHVMTGVRVDEISVYNNRGEREEIEATVVIDKEGGTFGGFEALLPYAAVRDAL